MHTAKRTARMLYRSFMSQRKMLMKKKSMKQWILFTALAAMISLPACGAEEPAAEPAAAEVPAPPEEPAPTEEELTALRRE